MDLAEKTDEVLERPSKAIDAPGCDDLELASDRVLAEPVEAGTLVATLRPANPMVEVDAVELPPAMLGNPLELPALVVRRLTIGGDPEVDRSPARLPHDAAAPRRSARAAYG
jgi:hypothetical protein